MLVVAHNLASMNTQRMLGINTKNKAKTMEKLSSGFDINRAADDAAGLAISEKMRKLIRGLEQGTRNAEDGISWTQIGDGALNEAHEILQRMNELSIQALNETNSEADRMALQSEFENLQTELDRISETTKFNELRIFKEHEATYYQCYGDIKWEPAQIHVVADGRNDLNIKYRQDKNSPVNTMSVTIPAGEYTTQELVDEIDSALEDAGGYHAGILFEYTDDGYCNVNYEGGEMIDSVGGALSYLLYDMYEGGDFGALIGTTAFIKPYDLRVTSANNTLEFTIEDFDGNVTNKRIVIPDGKYSQEEMIDMLNDLLKDTTVKATANGNSIKLGSDEAIVTKFKGNMFKIDTVGKSYDSVFYDNVCYGDVTMTSGYFRGGYVLTTNAKDEEHNKFEITSANNKLTLQPNGMDTPVTLTLAEGKYTATEMASHLNSLFTAASLELKAERVASGSFDGLKISSSVKGLDSKINFDTSSSAYNTLFVDKNYNSYGAQITATYDRVADRDAYFKGSKDLSNLGTTPLVVTAGLNDTFSIVLDGTSYDITMTAKTYSSVNDVITEINNQLNGSNAAAGYKDKVQVINDGDTIKIQAKDGSGISNVKVQAKGGNSGFDDIFQGYSITYTSKTLSGNGSVTMNKPYDGNIDAADSKFEVNVGGKEYDVNLPTGAGISQDQIKLTIEQAIPGYTETKPNTFSTISATGTTTDRRYSPTTATGTENVGSWSGSDVGITVKGEGDTKPSVNIPAKLKIEVPLNDNMVVADGTNQITLNINGTQRQLVLDNGTYTKSQLVTELQKKIDGAFGTALGGAKVSLDGDNLVITANDPIGDNGEFTSISCNTANSSFLKELKTTRGSAVWTSTYALSSGNMVIDDATNGFSFTYKEDGASKNISLTLANGTYNRNTLVNEINNKLKAQGVDVTASVNTNGKLVLTSGATGKDTALSYGTTSGGSSSNVIFGELITKTAANKVVNLKTEDSIQIDSSSNTFSITVNGAKQTVTLDSGTYTRDSFVNMLNGKLQGSGVEAYVTGDKIGYRTTATGREQSFMMNYNDGGTSMKKIYGETTTNYPGVTVSFDANGYMKLDTTPGTNISVNTGGDPNAGAFTTPVEHINKINCTTVSGYKSTTPAVLQGSSLPSDVEIDKYNNKFQFRFIDNGTLKNIDIQLADGTYTHDQLKSELQAKLDASAAGAGRLKVSVDGNGVRIESAGVGSNNKIEAMDGNFYDHVICKATEVNTTSSTSIKNGTQNVRKAFTVGRQDVLTEGANIKAGISDRLTLDLTHDGTVHTLEMKLTPGQYSADGIKKEIQKQLDEALKKEGFEPGFVEVGIGDINTGIIGANDTKALNFRLSEKVKAPGEGEYILDGVGGNAAFEVFYKTDGELIPAFVRGTRDVTSGVQIKQGENELHFKVDDVEYDIELEPTFYSADDLINVLNDKIKAEGAPLAASLDEGRVKISHTKLGNHKIQELSGSARDDIFFREYGEENRNVGVNIQLSSEVPDSVEIPRTEVSTTLLGINSICISKVKYATKAVDRIAEAIDKVSNIRGVLGTSQNKLEHAINSNKNKVENTSAADSRIRDTDMAKMTMENAKENILHQAAEAMLAQANQSNDAILTLLG